MTRKTSGNNISRIGDVPFRDSIEEENEY